MSSSTLIEKEEKKTDKKYIGKKRVEAYIVKTPKSGFSIIRFRSFKLTGNVL